MFNSTRKRMIPRPVLILTAATVLTAGNIASAGILIDDFTDDMPLNPWIDAPTLGHNSWIIDTGLTGAIKNKRLTTMGMFTANDPNTDSVVGSIDTANGTVSYQSTAGTVGDMVLHWDDLGSGLNLDLSGEGGIRVVFDQINFNFGGGGVNGGELPLIVRVRLFDGTTSSLLELPVFIDGPQTLNFDFSTKTNNNLINMNSIDLVAVKFMTVGGVDFTVSEVSTYAIPAPGVFALLGLSGMLMGRRRRR